jgi:hypothetical protein
MILYRPAARSRFQEQRSLLRPEPWWSMALWAPLFLRTLLRLVFVCPHRHRGPPITPRESIPSNLPGSRANGRETYVTCLDCGQKFAYNHKTWRLADFWGLHDAKVLAGVRRRVDAISSHLHGLAARVVGRNRGIPVRDLVSSAHRLSILLKGQGQSRRSTSSRWPSRPDLKQTQTRPEIN